jgi:hypothetical protein
MGAPSNDSAVERFRSRSAPSRDDPDGTEKKTRMETTTRHSDSPLTPEEIRDLLGEDDLDGVPFARITTSSRAVSGSSDVVPASFVPSTRPRVDVLSSTPLPENRRSPAPAAAVEERPRPRPISTDDLREVRPARVERTTPGVSGASRVVPSEDAGTRAASREALRALYEKSAQRPGSASGPVRRITEVRERVSVSGAHERVDQQGRVAAPRRVWLGSRTGRGAHL